MTTDWDPFRTWLLEHELLSRTSARKVVSDLRTLRTRGAAPEAERLVARLTDYRWAWALWADYCAQSGLVNDLRQPERPAKIETHRARRRNREPRRLKEAVSIPLEQWRAFLTVVNADDSRAGRVIDVICASALRVSDVLRTDRAALDEGFARADGITRIRVKGGKDVVYSVLGAEREWSRLHAVLAPGQLVADCVSPRGATGDWTAQGAAYQACRRKLTVLAQEAGVGGRVHLHRLRRTVAVQVGTATGNKLLVKKLLNHGGRQDVTDDYLDEGMALEVAKVLRAVRKKIRG